MSEKLDVLILEDSPNDAQLLVRKLSKEGHYQVSQEMVDSLPDFKAALDKHPWDIIISDHSMPQFSAFDALKELRERRLDIPIIIVSGTIEPHDAVEAMKAGASDFIMKDDTTRLLPAIERELREAKIRREKSLADQTLQERDADLAREQERFREITEAIHEVFFTSNIEHTEVIYISPAYEAIWGRSCESLYQSPRDWLRSIHSDDRERVLRSAVESSRSGQPYELEYRIVRPDGEIRWIKSRTFPVKDKTGQVYRLSGVANDVTQEKQLAAQFQQSQKMEVVGRLAGGVAHDFNNLLTAIMGFAELTLNHLPADHPVRSDLDEIVKTGERAAQLTKQLLAFSRRQVIEPKILDLNELVKKSENLLKRAIGEKVELSLKLSPSAAPILADSGQVDQVLVNLCVNARDAMPKGGELMITIEAVSLDKELSLQHRSIPRGDYVTLCVCDTGDGMSEEVKAHLFEPFFTTKPVGKGTGLGLSTCFGIIQQSRGFVQVESEPRKGTRFTIYFPRAKASEMAGAVTSRGETMVSKGETLLIAEDDPAVRRLACRLLQSSGYAPLEAAAGEEALKIVAEDTQKVIRLVVTDLLSPLASGKTLAQELKDARPDIKVLFASGDSDEVLLKEGVLKPGIAFLRKPFTGESLARKVREVLDAGAEGPDAKPRGHEKVLVVDDEEDYRLIVKDILESAGMDVLAVADGLAGLEALKSFPAGVVLVDWLMPKMDGETFCRALRQNPKIKNLPVLMLTVKQQIDEQVEALHFGADDFLIKPFKPEELLAHVRAALRQTKTPTP